MWEGLAGKLYTVQVPRPPHSMCVIYVSERESGEVLI